jgi:hypothetical protein
VHLLDDLDDYGTKGDLTSMLLEPVAWHRDAACVEADPEIFFPERGHSSQEARSYCARCPVVEECLTYALENRARSTGSGATPRKGSAGDLGISTGGVKGRVATSV